MRDAGLRSPAGPPWKSFTGLGEMTPAVVSTVEMPSGKDTAYENFPVVSWLLPVRLRPHIATFYRLSDVSVFGTN